ncbi:MAG: hypothetical protein RIG61_10190 [Deltaproteobacteria bacterium]
MNMDRICGTCKYWELLPQGCSSFWGRCNHPRDENSAGHAPPYPPGQDVHFNEGENCPCWEGKTMISAD